jgi:pilus assembly protein FimV
LEGRVRELEGQLQESRRLIELRNAELAQLQAQLAAKQSATAPVEAGSETAIEPPAAATESPPSTEEAQPPVQTSPTEATPDAEPAPAPGVQKSPAVTAPSVSSPVQGQSSLLDTLKEYWWAVAALLVAILALLGLRAWRSRQQSEFDDSLGRLATAGPPPMGRDFGRETAPIRAVEAEPAFLVEETATHQRPRFDEGAVAPRNVATDDTISSDTAVNLDQGDPLAEADFHMAYGLYDQAADLVRIAIAREPERRDLKLKLLEVYFVWGNKEQFLQAARELAGTRVQAAPGEWEKIVIMGKQLAPEDELFASGSGSGAAAGGVDLDLESGEGAVDFDLLGEAVPGASEGVDLDIGSALGDNTVESPTGTTDAHLALHEQDFSGDATTRQMTQQVRSDDTTEAPTIEQPGISRLDNPTIRQKVNMALRQSGADQTAELNIDDLGLDLSSLDTIDQPGLGASPDAATLVAGFDEHSRRVMAEAGQRDMLADEEPTMPPIRVHVSEGDVSATAQMAAIKENDLDFDFDARDGSNGVDVEFDVGTATASDSSYSATQRISAEDLALPDLEPVTMSEVGTKLDLARAYMDMGDPEGARNILDEVLQEGSVTQKQEAQRLLESLPG